MALTPSKIGKPIRAQLQRRLELLATENAAKRNAAAVRRTLELLSEENLSEVATKSRGGRTLTIDCGVLAQAWGDTRVVNRVSQLSRQGVKVERQTVASRFGETDFARERLVITF